MPRHSDIVKLKEPTPDLILADWEVCEIAQISLSELYDGWTCWHSTPWCDCRDKLPADSRTMLRHLFQVMRNRGLPLPSAERLEIILEGRRNLAVVIRVALRDAQGAEKEV